MHHDFSSKENLVQGFYERLQRDHALAAEEACLDLVLLEDRNPSRSCTHGSMKPNPSMASSLRSCVGLAAAPRSPLSPFSAQSAPAREAALAMWTEVVKGASVSAQRKLVFRTAQTALARPPRHRPVLGQRHQPGAAAHPRPHRQDRHGPRTPHQAHRSTRGSPRCRRSREPSPLDESATESPRHPALREGAFDELNRARTPLPGSFLPCHGRRLLSGVSATFLRRTPRLGGVLLAGRRSRSSNCLAKSESLGIIVDLGAAILVGQNSSLNRTLDLSRPSFECPLTPRHPGVSLRSGEDINGGVSGMTRQFHLVPKQIAEFQRGAWQRPPV